MIFKRSAQPPQQQRVPATLPLVPVPDLTMMIALYFGLNDEDAALARKVMRGVIAEAGEL